MLQPALVPLSPQLEEPPPLGAQKVLHRLEAVLGPRTLVGSWPSPRPSASAHRGPAPQRPRAAPGVDPLAAVEREPSAGALSPGSVEELLQRVQPEVAGAVLVELQKVPLRGREQTVELVPRGLLRPEPFLLALQRLTVASSPPPQRLDVPVHESEPVRELGPLEKAVAARVVLGHQDVHRLRALLVRERPAGRVEASPPTRPSGAPPRSPADPPAIVEVLKRVRACPAADAAVSSGVSFPSSAAASAASRSA